MQSIKKNYKIFARQITGLTLHLCIKTNAFCTINIEKKKTNLYTVIKTNFYTFERKKRYLTNPIWEEKRTSLELVTTTYLL